MKMYLYSIKDELKGFGSIAMCESDSVAIRDFTSAVTNNEIIKLNLKDYSLYLVGKYDTDLGKIEDDSKHEYPKLVIDAASCKRKE